MRLTSTTRKMLFAAIPFLLFGGIYWIAIRIGQQDWVQTLLLKTLLSRSLALVGLTGGSGILFTILLAALAAAEGSWSYNMVLPAGAEERLNLSGPTNSSVREWESFEERVLMESFPTTESESGTGDRSVNQGLPANAGAARGEEAGPANHHVPYPYEPDEMIGGDSVERIQRRILSKYSFPSHEEIERARYDAEDRFTVKVDIIRAMSALDPSGDWMESGARALDNQRTRTGEPSLEDLYRTLDDLNAHGRESNAFPRLKDRVRLRMPGGWESDADSEA